MTKTDLSDPALCMRLNDCRNNNLQFPAYFLLPGGKPHSQPAYKVQLRMSVLGVVSAKEQDVLTKRLHSLAM